MPSLNFSRPLQSWASTSAEATHSPKVSLASHSATSAVLHDPFVPLNQHLEDSYTSPVPSADLVTSGPQLLCADPKHLLSEDLTSVILVSS